MELLLVDDVKPPEALTAAKVELAEVCGKLDEARLQSRRELIALQRNIEAASEELNCFAWVEGASTTSLWNGQA